jgi:hypothetical protein
VSQLWRSRAIKQVLREDAGMISWLIMLMVLSVALIVGLRNGGWSTFGKDVSTSGKDARPYLIAIGICWVAPLALMLVLHVVLPHHNTDGQCNGLGFGCVPAPSDGVVILWALTLPFSFTAGLISCAIIAGVRRGRRRRKANLLAGRPMGGPPG